MMYLFYLIISLNSPITKAAADFLVYKAAVIENVVSNQWLFVSDVLLFRPPFVVRLNQIRMCYQVSTIIHQETPENGTIKAANQVNKKVNLI